MELTHENLRETCRISRDLGLGVRFKSCITVQAPAQFGTNKNDSFQVFRIRNCQQRKKNGEKIEVLAFYPVQQGKGKARIPATSSVEEYIQNLPHVLARHSEQSGSSGSGTSKRPFVPGAEANASGGKGLELNTNILFEAESPGSVLGLWKDRLCFLRKLCKDAGYGKLLAWLEKVQVC